MKKLINIFKNMMLVVILGGGLLTTGCQKDASMLASIDKNDIKQSVTENVVQSNRGAIRILSVDPEKRAKQNVLNKSNGLDTLFSVTKFIEKDRGGWVKVGDRKTVGQTKIKFKKNDLPEDLTIKLEWAPSNTLEGLLSNIEFGPHGATFNNPVKVELSYLMADLSGVNEENLQVYYFHEDTGVWEYIGGQVNTKKKIVTVYLEHFSRYALAAD